MSAEMHPLGQPGSSVFPLSASRPGDLVRVVRIEGGRRRVHRLLEMGIRNGQHLDVTGGGRGPVVIRHEGTRLAMGRGIARGVIVERLISADGV
jgi:ferrous iron transport protein A